MKTTVAFFFGCRSVEHEVSIISAVQAMNSVNRDKYDIIPVYVAKNGEMYSGEKLFEIKMFKPDVAFLCINGRLGNMNVDEALITAQRIGAKINIPNHYDMFACKTVPFI